MDCEQPLQSKTILNSRVLRYGQLNDNVASIMSMFLKEKVLKRKCIGEILERGTYIWEVWMMEKPGVVLQEIFQRKLFFLSKKFCKEKYSFLKSIFTKTSLIHDIYERNYIICEVSF